MQSSDCERTQYPPRASSTLIGHRRLREQFDTLLLATHSGRRAYVPFGCAAMAFVRGHGGHELSTGPAPPETFDLRAFGRSARGESGLIPRAFGELPRSGTQQRSNIHIPPNDSPRDHCVRTWTAIRSVLPVEVTMPGKRRKPTSFRTLEAAHLHSQHLNPKGAEKSNVA